MLEALPVAALAHILALLPLPDVLRVRSCCRRLRRAAADAVAGARLTQDDLEDAGDDALQAHPQARRLCLHGLQLDAECASLLAACSPPSLLQQLTRLEIWPASLEPAALAALVQACPRLIHLRTHGDWSAGAELAAPAMQQPRPQLRELVLQRNSQLTPAQLWAWLSLPEPARGCAHAGGTPRATPASWQQRLLQLQPAGAQPHSSADGCGHTIAPAWPRLAALDCSGCASQLGACWRFLAQTPTLTRLVLHSCTGVSNATLAALARALAEPPGGDGGCSAEPSGDSGIGSSSSSPPLRHVCLCYTRVSDAGMHHLAAALPSLECVRLKGCNVGDDGLTPLLALQHLTALHIKHAHRVTDEGIAQLSGLSQLRSLSYGFTSMPEADEVARAIGSSFPRLTALDLLASELTDEGLSHLGALASLASLRLYQAGVTDSGLSALARQPAGACLSSLVLFGLGGVRELACLGDFLCLQQLALGRLCDLRHSMGEALQQLTALRHLGTLTLERMDGAGAGALRAVLRGCRSLRHLRVRDCAGLRELDMVELARGAAAEAASSSCVWVAGPSADTDDEEDGWQLLPP